MSVRSNEEKRLVQVVEGISRELLALKLQECKKVDSMDLSMSHFQYIETIRHLGQPTLSELATGLGVSRPAVTAFVNKLITLDIVKKEQSPEDRRSFTIQLTPRGIKLAAAYEKALIGFAATVKKGLTASEFSSLVLLLEKAFPHT